MSTFNTAIRDILADAFGDLWDQGAEPSPSKLQIFDGGVQLVEIELPADPFGAAANADISMVGLPVSASATADGIADTAKMLSADGTTYIWDGLRVEIKATVAWAADTAFVAGDRRLHNGATYICTEDHNSSDADTEPGVGDGWRDVWDKVHVALDNTDIKTGQIVKVSSFTMTAPVGADS